MWLFSDKIPFFDLLEPEILNNEYKNNKVHLVAGILLHLEIFQSCGQKVSKLIAGETSVKKRFSSSHEIK